MDHVEIEKVHSEKTRKNGKSFFWFLEFPSKFVWLPKSPGDR